MRRALQPVRRRDCIVVKENEVFSLCSAHAEIAAAGETEILAGGNDAKTAAAPLRRGNTAVIAAVIHDDDFMGKRSMLAQGAQAAQQDFFAAPGLRAERQESDVAGREPDAQERCAQQQEADDDRDEHLPRVRHDRAGEPRPEAARVPSAEERGDGPGIDPRPQDGQQRGEKGDAVEDGEEHDDRPREADRSEIAEAKGVETEQPDGHRETGEHDGETRGAERPRELAGSLLGLVDVVAVELGDGDTLIVKARNPRRFFRDFGRLVLEENLEVRHLEPLDDSAQAILGYLLSGRRMRR